MEDEEEFEEDNEESTNMFATIYQENKKLIWILIAVIVLILLMVIFGKSTSSNNNNNNSNKDSGNETTITMSSQTETISINDYTKLTVTINDNKNPNIIWTSTDSSVATVDKEGNVRAIKAGTATIVATYQDSKNKTYTAKCVINVVEGNVGVELKSVKFKDGSLIMSLNSTYDLSYERDPYNAMVKDNAFSSTNESVIKVDKLTGKVTAVGIGTGTIRVAVNGKHTASIDVYVIDKQVSAGIYVIPTSLTFKETSYNVEVGDSKKLNYTFSPIGADISFIEFTTNNSNVATVSETGFVKGISPGDAQIRATIGGVSATTTVHVTGKVVNVSSINVSDNNVSLKVGETHKIVASFSPADATNRELKYDSNNTSIVTVDNNGNVTGVKEGSTYVKVTSKANNNASVNVFFKVSGNSGGSNGGNGGSNGGSSGGNSNGVATVKITSDNNAVQLSYENALKEVRTNYPTLTITANGNYSYIKYCTNAYGSSNCTPNLRYNGPFELNKTGITVIRAQAVYNGKDGEILTRYVNIKGSGSSTNNKSCYCNPSNGTCIYGTKSGNYTTDVSLSEGLCNAYINRGNQGCFVYNGGYVWGSHLGKTSSYVYISSVTASNSCISGSSETPSTPQTPTTPAQQTFNVTFNKSYGYNVAIDNVRILQYDVKSTSNVNRFYFCESSSSSKCIIDLNNATRKTGHFDLRVLSNSVYDTGSNYNRTYYFDDLSGTNFKFFIYTVKGHSITVLATDSSNRVSTSYSTTAQ